MLSQEIVKAVKYEIREDCVEEALMILSLSDEEGREEFMHHFNKDNGICCLVIDRLKYELIKAGKIEDDGGCFNGWKIFI